MSIARKSIIVSLLSVVATAVGFLNQLVIAHAFGASAAFDGYLQASSIPLAIAGAIGGVFAYAMVPALIRAMRDPDRCARVTGAFLLTFVALATGILLGGWIASPLVVRFISRGHPSVALSEAIVITRLTWASAACAVGVGFGAAILNTHGRFALPVALAALPYVGGAAAVLLLGASLGVTSLAVGMLAGTAISVALLCVSTRRFIRVAGITRADFEAVRQFGRAAPVALVSVAAFTVYQTIDSFWAPQIGPSNLSVLGYCQRLLIALGTILAAGPSVILQPRLAAASAAGDSALFLRDLRRAIELTILVCAPVALWVSWLGAPIIRVAFERGAFDRTVTLAVAGVLPYMLFGMIPMLCTVMLFKALYARNDLRAAALLGLAGPALYFGMSGWLLGHGLAGIGTSYALTWCALSAAAALRVWKRVALGKEAGRFVRQVGLLLATALATAVSSGWLLSSWETDPPVVLLGKLAGASIVTAASCAFVALRVARIDDMRTLARAFMRAPQSA